MCKKNLGRCYCFLLLLGTYGRGRIAPAFASLSAISFPKVPMCALT